MSDPSAPQIIARITPSQPRRWIAMTALAGLGAVTIWIAVAETPVHILATVFLLVFGAACFWLADRMRRATQVGLVLTEAGLSDDSGRMIAPAAQMVAVSRGAFAFKPSNGFLLTLDRSGRLEWAPGLWWRIGRRIGVGGVISNAEGRFMGEMIQTVIVGRDKG